MQNIINLFHKFSITLPIGTWRNLCELFVCYCRTVVYCVNCQSKYTRQRGNNNHYIDYICSNCYSSEYYYIYWYSTCCFADLLCFHIVKGKDIQLRNTTVVTFATYLRSLSVHCIYYVAIKFRWNWAAYTEMEVTTLSPRLLAATCGCLCVNTKVGRMLPHFLKVRAWLLVIVIANAGRAGYCHLF